MTNMRHRKTFAFLGNTFHPLEENEMQDFPSNISRSGECPHQTRGTLLSRPSPPSLSVPLCFAPFAWRTDPVWFPPFISFDLMAILSQVLPWPHHLAHWPSWPQSHIWPAAPGPSLPQNLLHPLCCLPRAILDFLEHSCGYFLNRKSHQEPDGGLLGLIWVFSSILTQVESVYTSPVESLL